MTSGSRKDATARPYHHRNLRQSLVDTAIRMIDADENWAFSMRQLAERAGVTHNAPYNHFAGKSELLAEVAACGFDMLAHEMEQAAKGRRSVRGRLDATGIAYVTFAAAHRGHYRLMFGPAVASGYASERLLKAGERAYAVLVDAIKDCAAAGVLRSSDVSMAALSAWALVHGLAMLIVDERIARAHPKEFRTEILAAQVNRIMQDGLLLTPTDDERRLSGKATDVSIGSRRQSGG